MASPISGAEENLDDSLARLQNEAAQLPGSAVDDNLLRELRQARDLVGDAEEAVAENGLEHENIGYLLRESLRVFLMCLVAIEGTSALYGARDKARTVVARMKSLAARRLKQVRWELGVFDSRWVGGWYLGNGAYGEANLWLKRNSRSIVTDRLVVKDTHQVQGDPRMSIDGKHKGIPAEVRALYDLRPLKGSNSVIKVRNWRIARKQRMTYFKLYLEYAPYGDLQNVYREARKAEDHVPEPFMWYCFEQLTTACILMERGELEQHGMKPWTPMVHRDMRPDNVFLGSKSKKQYRGYPEPKLADFGLTLYCKEDDKRPVQPASHTGFCAPEMLCEAQPAYLEDGVLITPMTSKTNVWTIGMTMWSMIFQTTFSNAAKIKYSGTDDEKMPRQFTAKHERQYSAELRDLIRECLAFRPSDRIDLDELLRLIKRHTIRRRKDGGLRNAEAEHPTFRELRLKHPYDKWASGEWLQAGGDMPLGKLPTGMNELPDPLPKTWPDYDSDDELGGQTGEDYIFVRNPNAVLEQLQ